MSTPPPARAPLKPLDEMLVELMAFAEPLGRIETVSTFEADGRVLAQDAVSALTVPPRDNSAMDGYAVRCADLAAAAANGSAGLPVSQRIPAGSSGTPLAGGTVARIFTGAPVPEGADAIVMQEDVEAFEQNGQPYARIKAQPQPGQWIRRAGEDVTSGAVVLPRGSRLTPAELGMAATIGLAQLQVAQRPRVALFSTGDELVMPGDVPPEAMRPGAIYNSNRFFLRALLQRAGCKVTDLGIVPDKREATIAALRDASAGHDLILTSGGVSVGEEDHIKPSVQALGHLTLWQVSMKPGKPFAYGRVGQSHFIGLPGNPVSSFVTFMLLVKPFLLKLMGASGRHAQPVLLPARFNWPRPDKRREFLRARRTADGGLELFPNQSSGVLTSAVWGDGLIDNPGSQAIASGDLVKFYSFAEMMG